MSHSIPPPSERRHGIAELLKLVDKVKAIVFDLTLSDADQARRVRDLLNEHNHTEGDPPMDGPEHRWNTDDDPTAPPLLDSDSPDYGRPETGRWDGEDHG